MSPKLYKHSPLIKKIADYRLFEGILDHIADPVFVKDRNHCWIYGNHAFWEIMGGEPEKFLGKSDYDFFPKEESDVFWEKDNQVFETGETVLNEEFFTDAKGVQHIISTKKALFINHNEPVLVGIIRDITVLKEMDRLKNDFVSMVSHELRTPLTSIRASLELLTSSAIDLSSEEVLNMVNIALRNTGRLEKIVTQILDLEKIKSGKMQLNITPVALSPFLRQAIDDNTIYGRKYAVTFELEPISADYVIMADANSLAQIITNLLSNAAKFSHKNSAVTIRALPTENNTLFIEVEDKGIGIPDDFKDRIFGRFHRADLSATNNRDGTGLGLNICKHLLESMHGRITYESEQNQGSIFRIELPRLEAL